MPPAPVDLTDVYRRLNWAEHHIDVLRNRLDAFTEQNPAPFAFRTEKRRGAGETIEYTLYAVVREEPPQELGLILGDVAHHVRAALDNLVYLLSSPRARKSGRTSFPIFTDECEFKVNGVKGIESIKGDERTFIERVQPYVAYAHAPNYSPLDILRRLTNLDKHQLPVPIIASTKERDTWLATDNAEVKFRFIEQGPVKHDTPIVRFTARPKDPALEMKVQPQSGLEIQIRDVGLTKWRMNVLDVARMLHGHVRHRVIGVWFEYGMLPHDPRQPPS